MFFIIYWVAHITVGLLIARGMYAREVYRRATRLTGHASNCDTLLYLSRNYPCDCGYKNKPEVDGYIAVAVFWPLWVAYALPKMIITSGSYVPKEVKAARRAEELDKVRGEFEARTQALEVAAGIRKN